MKRLVLTHVKGAERTTLYGGVLLRSPLLTAGQRYAVFVRENPGEGRHTYPVHLRPGEEPGLLAAPHRGRPQLNFRQIVRALGISPEDLITPLHLDATVAENGDVVVKFRPKYKSEAHSQ